MNMAYALPMGVRNPDTIYIYIYTNEYNCFLKIETYGNREGKIFCLQPVFYRILNDSILW